jgi:nucleotide-binding universal stress UspA family protein
MYKKILLPIDLYHKHSWRNKLSSALEIARCFSSELYVLNVVPNFGSSIVAQYFTENNKIQMMQDAERNLKKFVNENIPENLKITCIVTQGTVYESIIRAANHIKVNLIIISAHRPEFKDYLLGPNAAKVVRHSNVSVLVVRD